MATIFQTISHKSGIPLGGIGTGSVEIRPDGLFHEWQIFNCGQWSPGSPKCGEIQPMNNPDDLFFMVRTEDASGEIICRYLALCSEMHDLYSLAWARCVEGIVFDATFPVARMMYQDDALPIELQAEAFSPFIPLDSRTSGTPGFYVRFIARNLTDAPVRVSILGVLRNAAGYAQASRIPHNRLEKVDGGRAIVLGADGLDPDLPCTGDMTFAAAGGEISYITGCYPEERRAARFWSSRYGLKAFTLLHQFREDGRLPNLNPELPPELPEVRCAAEGLSEDERKAMLDRLLQYPAFYDMYQRLRQVDPNIVESAEFIDELAANIAQQSGRRAEWGYACLSSSSELAPACEEEALFAIGWYFPNHISPTGENIGHAYEHWFDSSLDVVRFLLEGYREIRPKVFALSNAFDESSLPAEAADAITGQLTTLVKCTWWTRAGHFGVWEGLGCCGFHTTDITYQGSWPIASLFPDLQKKQMEHGASFQREDGRVHHFFTPDFSAVDNGFDRVDMNPQFVMLAARDYLWTGDKGYLQRLWPHIIRAMENSALLDSDGDGLPDSDTRRNTYDAWDFQGCPSYISSLWLGALKASIRLAEEMGDPDRAARWQETYEKGLRSFEEKLWNGEYYVLWRDGDEIDECCMSDQMSGDWFSSACGWGNILDRERIRKALDAIFRYNFTRSEGLINASYPPGKMRRLAASGNFQADAPWTGIEYTVASLMIDYRMVPEGLAIIQDIGSRYLQAGRFWNHVECGDHYYRAMSSWTVLLALSGFRWDCPRGRLTLAPAIIEPECEYPFFTGGSWGRYRQSCSLSETSASIQLLDGEVILRSIRLPGLKGLRHPRVTLDGVDILHKVEPADGGISIEFDAPVALTVGKTLTVCEAR